MAVVHQRSLCTSLTKNRINNDCDAFKNYGRVEKATFDELLPRVNEL